MASAKLGVITNWDAMEEQIIFYRTHLDIFIEEAFPPQRLTPEQHVIARAIGNCSDIKIVQSRGAGKTWLTAICCHALCCLYPGTFVAVCSATAKQAREVIVKLKLMVEQNQNMANELSAANSKFLVQLTPEKGKATYKNGSKIESFSIDSLRGQRAKVVVCDENAYMDQQEEYNVISPVLNFRRDISFSYDFMDYASKKISITSACPKANTYFDEFSRVLRDMAKGSKQAFACAQDYRAAVHGGITSMEFFMNEKKNLPELVFATEYESKFIGADSNSAFPFNLTQSCRTQQNVELEQPKNSKSRYVISQDIATSSDRNADNSVITVIKFTERNDGTFLRKVVYLQSFHGETLDKIAIEIRDLCHRRFPNTEKIIYDARGLGDSFDRFFDREYVDFVTGKEYPPLVVDDQPNVNPLAKQMLHPFRAILSLNQRIYTNLRVAQEKKTIEIPMSSSIIRSIEAEAADKSQDPIFTKLEHAVYQEADALQMEMGNVVAKVSSNGNITYDTTSNKKHKDRYSSLAMGNDYISELEKENVKRCQRGRVCVGLATAF